MMRQILSMDFNASANIWVIQLGLPDGRRGQAQFGPDSFNTIRACPMGQFMLHAWLGRANMRPPEPEPPAPATTEEKVA